MRVKIEKVLDMETKKILKILIVTAAVAVFTAQIGIIKTNEPDSTSTDASVSQNEIEAQTNIRAVTEKIEAIVDISPETLDTSVGGMFTVFVRLPEPYDVDEIDSESVICERASPEKIMTATFGEKYFIAQFNMEDIDLNAGEKVTLTVTGKLNDGTVFEGSDTVNII